MKFNRSIFWRPFAYEAEFVEADLFRPPPRVQGSTLHDRLNFIL